MHSQKLKFLLARTLNLHGFKVMSLAGKWVFNTGKLLLR